MTDYHRFCVPLGGEVREVRNAHGRVCIDVARNDAGSVGAVNGDTWPPSLTDSLQR